MHFHLRPFTLNDVDSLVRYANNYHIAKNLTDRFPHPYTAEDGRRFIEMTLQADPVTVFTIDIHGAASGGIGLHPQTDIYRKNAELGYWLAEPFWGNGIITRAIAQMIDFGFENLDIERIFARPFGSNLASQRVLEKTGFILEARMDQILFKNGVFEDELIYAVRRANWSKQRSPDQSFPG